MLEKTEAWMPAKKRRPGCLTKKRMHATKTYYISIIPALYRIIPYNVVGHLAVAMGKRFAWATWQYSENQKCVRLGHLAIAMGKGGGGWHVHTKNAETHSHAQSRGGGGHQPYSKHTHNLSIPSYVIQVLQTWAVS